MDISSARVLSKTGQAQDLELDGLKEGLETEGLEIDAFERYTPKTSCGTGDFVAGVSTLAKSIASFVIE